MTRAALWHRLPRNFDEQLDALAGRVDEYHFDDGYDDVLLAADELEKRGLRGVFFIVPGWLGIEGQAGRAEVLDLHRRGHTIGNHTMHHVWMAKVPMHVQSAEWYDAQDELRDITGQEPERFAWPYGLGGPITIGPAPRGIGPMEVFAPRSMTADEIRRSL